MTIDEQVRRFSGSRMSLTDEAFETRLREAFLAVARDQRYACVEAVLAVGGDNNNPWMIDKDAAQNATMNATIK